MVLRKKEQVKATTKLSRTQLIQKKIERLFKTKNPDRIQLPRERSVKVGKKQVGFKLIGKIVLIVVIALVVFLTVLGIGIYRYGWENSTTKWVSRIIPYPAALVNYHLITVYKYRKSVASTEHYYSKLQGVNFDTESGKEQITLIKQEVLDQMIEDEIVKIKAKKFDISVDEKEVNTEYSKIVEQSGGETKVKEILNDYYQWSVKEFKIRLKMYLLGKKLQDKVTTDDSINETQKAKATDILNRLKQGEKFTKVAKKYSEDKTNSAAGGYLGFFKKGQKDDSALDEAVFSLKKKQISEVIKIKTGYAIFQVTKIKGAKRAVYYVLVKFKDFNEWLQEQKDAMKIYKYAK